MLGSSGFVLSQAFQSFQKNRETPLSLPGLFIGQAVQTLSPLTTAQRQQPLSKIHALRRQTTHVGAAVRRVLPALDEAALNHTVNDACGGGQRGAKLIRDHSHTAVAVTTQRKKRPQLRHRELYREPIVMNGRPQKPENNFQVNDEALGNSVSGFGYFHSLKVFYSAAHVNASRPLILFNRLRVSGRLLR